MTAVKNNGILKRMGALVMALGLTCALAVSASATETPAGNAPLEAGVMYTPYLTVDAAVPHTLDFFVEDEMQVYDDENGNLVVDLPLAMPATITVTVGGNSFTQTGEIATATCADPNYDVSLSEDGTVLTVVCHEDDMTVDYQSDDGTVYGTFAPVITFTVDLGNESVQHRAVPATLHLMGESA